MLPFLRYSVYNDLTIWPLVTPNDLWAPSKTIGMIYSVWPIHMVSMTSLKFTLLEKSCLQAFSKIFTIWPPVTPNDLWPPPKTIEIIYLIWPIHMVSMTSLKYTLLEKSCLQAFSKIFTIWPPVTPNDLWPPPKTIEIIYLIWVVYMPSMRSLRVTLLEI